MSDPEYDDVDGVQADTADVLEQAETEGGEPVADALDSRDPIPSGDRIEDERLTEDAEEAEGGAATGD